MPVQLTINVSSICWQLIVWLLRFLPHGSAHQYVRIYVRKHTHACMHTYIHTCAHIHAYEREGAYIQHRSRCEYREKSEGKIKIGENKTYTSPRKKYKQLIELPCK